MGWGVEPELQEVAISYRAWLTQILFRTSGAYAQQLSSRKAQWLHGWAGVVSPVPLTLF